MQTLIELAVARRGDKGDIINIDVAARSTEAFEILLHHPTADQVGAYLDHLGADQVERFSLHGSRPHQPDPSPFWR